MNKMKSLMMFGAAAACLILKCSAQHFTIHFHKKFQTEKRHNEKGSINNVYFGRTPFIHACVCV